MAEYAPYSVFVPWSWEVTPYNTTPNACPSVGHILRVYGLATFVTTAAGLVTGNRYFTKLFTCGKFGKKETKSWTFMWVPQWCCFFGGDLIVAYLTINAPDYNTYRMPDLADLALFYTSRPRMAFIFLGVFGLHSAYDTAAKQIMISESIMQILGTVYMGKTAHFAATHGYYEIGAADPTYARLMYAGALLTLITTVASIAGLAAVVVIYADKDLKEEWYGKALVLIALGFGFGAFIGRWIFLIGYLKLAEDA